MRILYIIHYIVSFLFTYSIIKVTLRRSIDGHLVLFCPFDKYTV